MFALNNREFNIPQPALSLLKTVGVCLNESGMKGYIVGGFIRDLILGRNTADIDIAVAADALDFSPKLAQALNGKFIPMDKENRIARIILKNASGSTGTRQIDISSVKSSIEEDLSQRDFTVNAMALPLQNFTDIMEDAIIDPFGGLTDIRNKIIRIVSDKAFEMDALRLLRGARLSTELGFIIDKQTEDLMRKQCHLIKNVSGERIREELLRLLAAPKTGDLILYMENMGLITALIPELIPSKGMEQPNEHYWDVFIHSVKTIDAVDSVLKHGKWEYNDKAVDLIPWSPELSVYFNENISGGSTRLLLHKLTALLHDIAKPKTMFVDEQGKTRFYGHPREGAPIVKDIMERLRFSNKETKIVTDIVFHHLRPTQMTQMGITTDHAIYRYFRDVGEVAIDTLFFTLADHMAARGPNLDIKNWQQHTASVRYILEKHREQENIIISPKIVDGDDIIREFGLKPGQKIGELLEAVREAQASSEVVTKEEALDYIKSLLNG
jgi:poly(A) polymerase